MYTVTYHSPPLSFARSLCRLCFSVADAAIKPDPGGIPDFVEMFELEDKSTDTATALFRRSSLAVFYYNVWFKNKTCRLGGESVEPDPLYRSTGIVMHADARTTGTYVVADRRLLTLAQTPPGALGKEDFGITIAMLFFARYYANNQYTLLAHHLQDVDEFRVLVLKLTHFRESSLRLPLNMAIHPQYSLKGGNFCGTAPITMAEYYHLMEYMMDRTCQVECFVRLVRKFHPLIVESLYMFTSLSKECLNRIILDCDTARRGTLTYSFRAPIAGNIAHRQYWLQLPARAIWFAYSQGYCQFKVPVSDDRLLDRLARVPHAFILGFLTVDPQHRVTDMYVVQIVPPSPPDGDTGAGPSARSVWSKTVQVAAAMNLKCALRPREDPLPNPPRGVLFVVESNDGVLYKPHTLPPPPLPPR